VVELSGVDLTTERQQSGVSALSLLAILPQVDFIPAASEVPWSVVCIADESPPHALAPEQGHSPRAPPCA
jgi:hypothetical protein